jgi:hypothetical protein
MALKDIWQQERRDRLEQQAERQQNVAEMRVTNRTALDQMAVELRESLSQILPELRSQNQARQLEEQCYRAGLQIEVQDRRNSVQERLTELNLERQQTAEALRSSLAAFRADLQAQADTDRTDRQAYVQGIRDYVWGDEAVQTLQPVQAVQAVQPVQSQSAPIAVTPDSVEALLEADLDELEEKSTHSAIDAQLQRLDDRILAILNSDSGVRLADLQSTLKVNREDLVKGLQALVKTRQVIARDRTYFLA